MIRVFLNYRRDDTDDWAEPVRGRLESEFDEVFLDIHARIPPGGDFVRFIEVKLKASHAMLVLIGPNWLPQLQDRQAQTARRDHVVEEIRIALHRDLVVSPVLCDYARMPRADELPDAIHPLGHLQATPLGRRSQAGFTLALLVRQIRLAVAHRRRFVTRLLRFLTWVLPVTKDHGGARAVLADALERMRIARLEIQTSMSETQIQHERATLSNGLPIETRRAIARPLTDGERRALRAWAGQSSLATRAQLRSLYVQRAVLVTILGALLGARLWHAWPSLMSLWGG